MASAERLAIAQELGGDPILVGLLVARLAKDPSHPPQELTRDVVLQHVEDELAESAATSGSRYVEADYRTALVELGHAMLLRKDLQPSWPTVTAWLRDHGKTGALRELAATGKLCSLQRGAQGEDMLVFRHDRIRDELLARSIARAVQDSEDSIRNFLDPYFASIVGRALSHEEIPDSSFAAVRRQLPLALFYALMFCGGALGAAGERILKQTEKWIADHTVPDGRRVAPSVLRAICFCLAQTDSAHVLSLTKELPFDEDYVLLARIRNGCVGSAIAFCSQSGSADPQMTYALRDFAFARAAQRHRERFIKGLRQYMQKEDIEDNLRRGAIRTCGYMFLNELANDVRDWWRSADNRQKCLGDAMWATMRCCTASTVGALDEMYDCWASMPDKPTSKGMPSEQGWLLSSLEHSLQNESRPEVVRSLIAAYERLPSLRWYLQLLISSLDDPDAQAFTAARVAETTARAKEEGGFSPWAHTVTDKWDAQRPHRRALSHAARARLESIWQDPKRDEGLRYQAFRLWLVNIQPGELPKISSVSGDSPLYRLAIWARARHGDRTVVDRLLTFLEKDTWFFNVAWRVWCQDIMCSADKWIGKVKSRIPDDYSGGQDNDNYLLADLMMKVPRADAEQLLTKHWDTIGYAVPYMLSALYVGTPRCLHVFDESISRCPPDVDPFHHLGPHLGVISAGKDERALRRVLDSLVPYLDRMSEEHHVTCVSLARSLGRPEWAEQHLKGKLNAEHSRKLFPSDGDLAAGLDSLLNEQSQWPHVYSWLDGFKSRCDSPSRAMDVLRSWLAGDPCMARYSIAADCIALGGQRCDMRMLDEYVPQDGGHRAKMLREDAAFCVCERSLS